MINTIILSKNFYFVKNVLENMDPDFYCRVMSNISEVKKGVENGEIDLILLDDDLDQRFKRNILYKCQRFTMILNLHNDFKDMVLNPVIKNRLDTILKHHQEEVLRNRILLELLSLGYSVNLQGTYFLLDTIIETLHRKEEITYNLFNDIYPVIAKKYGKTVYNISNSIYLATLRMYCECSPEKIKKYFYFYDDVKPTIKQVLITIINKFW